MPEVGKPARSADVRSAEHGAAALPSVTVAIPVFNEEGQIEACLAGVEAQTYSAILEVLVVDGGSTDSTRARAMGHAGVRVVENPRRSRPAAMNVALREAKGDVLVRVDARTALAPDYVERCVEAIERSGAAIVGGPMRLEAASASGRGVAAAMSSRLGGGPAAFRRTTGPARFVDTVYLGSYLVEVIRGLGGYDEVFGGNEDAELAFRAQNAGGVYLDPDIHSSYAVRADLRALASQYFRYGRARAGTICKHPRSLSPRQLAVPALFLGLLSPWRKPVFVAYLAMVLSRVLAEVPKDPAAAPSFAVALPVMHASWGAGFAKGLARGIVRAAKAGG